MADIEMINEKQVMQMMHVSSRMTIWKYTDLDPPSPDSFCILS